MKRLFGGTLVALLLITAGCGTTPGGTSPTTTGPTSAADTTTTPGGIATGTSPAAGTGLTAVPGDGTAATSAAGDGTAATSAAGGTTATSAAGGTTATSAAGGATGSTNGIAEALANDTRFSTLAAALTTSGLDETLSQAGPYTLFAPTNEAFAALPAERLQTLLADPNAIAELLQYHVASGMIRSSELGTLTTIPTLSGKSISVSQNGTGVMLDGSAQVMAADIEATNGVIHQIDTVLTPPAS